MNVRSDTGSSDETQLSLATKKCFRHKKETRVGAKLSRFENSRERKSFKNVVNSDEA